ncbi:gamma-glutamyl-gamma-aminobutyrate hydrolase [Marinobacter daqiaonensis]|uniref:gamma-glutamyl-gamma-aminobutyrate hydrolase n=1 Tax=Marinobacter daqiaonensis TaxID=650891 RepID=A0A1I6IDJ3_9GAMM|nr:gamma-glutamyl-gamma-aminobutyrate hydrolase family protein [Marinobacter daqiaonensis]SFR64694.1 gamma-glutamyl-gamma-aminobutyrate hydrolase [Marinobacter daqiaonensis]
MVTQHSPRAVEAPRPLIGISACSQHTEGEHPIFTFGEKYTRAVSEGAQGIAVAIPALGNGVPLDQLVQRLDGILLTGSPSNIEPHHYRDAGSEPGTAHDPKRDATTLPLIWAAVAAGVPILGICRGFQEMNVALGGTLYQKLHTTGRFQEHRENKNAPLAERYSHGHTIRIIPGGSLARIWDRPEPVYVNSLHEQGIRALAPGLQVEAVAEDGLVEAFSLTGAPAFTLAVQWHPEWQWHPGHAVGEFPFYRALLGAFGKACAIRQRARDRARGAVGA